MSVTASPDDLPPGTATTNPQAVGKGQSLLDAIAVLQALADAAPNPGQFLAAKAQLNLLQIGAVDYFMGSFWVSADQILATFSPLPFAGKNNAYITSQLALISKRAALVVALVARGPLPITIGNEGEPQYSRSYPEPMAGYPLTDPDTCWYQLQMQLVDFLMTMGVVPASLILSTMTGAQTYPTNIYTSNYTSYQNCLDN